MAILVGYKSVRSAGRQTTAFKNQLSFHDMSIAPVTEAQRKCVKDDINMDDNQMESKIKHIKEWMKKQRHLPDVPDNIAEKIIFSFLISTKLSTESAKVKLDTYYAMRQQLPELFSNRDPTQQDVRDSVDKIRYFPVSKLTPDCIRVCIMSYISEKDKRFSAQDFIAFYKRAMAICDARMQKDDFCRGDYLVFDCRGFYKSHLTDLPWMLAQKFTSFIQDGLPIRIKGIFVINAPSYVDFVMSLLKPVLKEKLRKRIHIFQGDHTHLFKFMPQEILPSDYGGCGPTIHESSQAWQRTIESMRDFLVEDTNRKTDESKRPPDCPIICGQIFGVNGTFNKLNVD